MFGVFFRCIFRIRNVVQPTSTSIWLKLDEFMSSQYTRCWLLNIMWAKRIIASPSTFESNRNREEGKHLSSNDNFDLSCVNKIAPIHSLSFETHVICGCVCANLVWLKLFIECSHNWRQSYGTCDKMYRHVRSDSHQLNFRVVCQIRYEHNNERCTTIWKAANFIVQSNSLSLNCGLGVVRLDLISIFFSIYCD